MNAREWQNFSDDDAFKFILAVKIVILKYRTKSFYIFNFKLYRPTDVAHNGNLLWAYTQTI